MHFPGICLLKEISIATEVALCNFENLTLGEATDLT